MGSTFGGLSMVSRSLIFHQIAQNTVGHNVSNVDTPGYSRQLVNLLAMKPTGEEFGRWGRNRVGDGVILGSIVRARDVFTDRQYWKESAGLGYLQTANYILNKVEMVFREPSETGIQSILNQFWSSWQSLSTDSSSIGNRTMVAQRGVALAKAINDAATQLLDRADDINFGLRANVDTINRITATIADLNMKIAYIETGTFDHANDLRDSRDFLVDELSKLISVSVREDDRGRYTVTAVTDDPAGDFILVAPTDKFEDLKNNPKLRISTVTDPNTNYGDHVDGDFGYERLVVMYFDPALYDPRDPGFQGEWEDEDNWNEITFNNGEVRALLDYRDTATSGVYRSLEDLSRISQFLLIDFNEAHRAGYGTDNLNDRNFFSGEDTVGGGTTVYTVGYFGGSHPDGLSLDWIRELQVNSDITANLAGVGTGLAIIAAKTVANRADLYGSRNFGEGYPVITTSGVYDPDELPVNVLLRVTGTNADGNVTGMEYSINGGSTWGAVTITAGTGAISVNGATADIDISQMNAVIGDQYSFELGVGSIAGPVAIPAGVTNQGQGEPGVTVSGAYTGGTTPTNILMEVTAVDPDGNIIGMTFSEDGGQTWEEVVGNISSPWIFISQGVEVKLDPTTVNGPQVGDRYEFALSAGSMAGAVTDAPRENSVWTPPLSVASATGIYTGGPLATDVILRVDGGAMNYSLDGGRTWAAVPGDDTITVGGVDVTFNLDGMTAAANGDMFFLSVSAGNNALGDNAILLGNKLKVDSSDKFGLISLDAFYAQMIATLGGHSQDSQRLERNQQLVMDQLFNLRQQTSGVHLDEELTDMLRYQKGYNSAARVLTTMDEMLDKLINGTGIVGR